MEERRCDPDESAVPDAPEARRREEQEHDDRLIEAHLRLTPAERLAALQSFVDDMTRLRDGRRPPVR